MKEVKVCLQASGVYSEAVAEFLYSQGHQVSVVNPARIKGYAQATLSRHKTDRVDARLIADFCRTQDLPTWSPPKPEIRDLQALVRRIETLTELIQMEQNRLESAGEMVKPSIERTIAALEQEIRVVEELIKKHFDNHPDLKQQRQLLETIPGIGEKTANLLLGEIEFSKYSSAREVAALVGLTPQKRQSGTSLNRTRLSKLGNKRVRKSLYLPAVVAKNHNQIVKEFAVRLAATGKSQMQIVCACMRKLIHLVFGVLKTKKAFDANFIFQA